MSEEKKLTLEEHFDSIETILKGMEQEEIGLEESFVLYQSGLKEIQECNEMLDSMEQAIMLLNADGELEEF